MKKIVESSLVCLFIATVNITYAQNVGIGTTTPIEKLSVATAFGYGISHEASGIKLSTYIDASGGWIGTVSNNPFHFYTNNGTALMTINTNGNIGIGNPGAAAGKLEIRHVSEAGSPTLLLYDNTASNYTRLRFQNSSGANYWDIAGLLDNTHSISRLNFYHSNAGNVMSLTGDGNVGIGTSNPASRLSVNGDMTANAYYFTTPVTKFYTLNGSDLRPDVSTCNYQFSSGYIYMTSGSASFIAPVHLPHGSVITAFIVFYHDSNGSNNLDVRLVETDGIGSYNLIAQTISSGTPGNSLMLQGSLSKIVSNSTNSLYLSASSYPGLWTDATLKIFRVQVNYTMTGPE